jgi:hypothetical protein
LEMMGEENIGIISKKNKLGISIGVVWFLLCLHFFPLCMCFNKNTTWLVLIYRGHYKEMMRGSRGFKSYTYGTILWSFPLSWCCLLMWLGKR